MNKLLMSGSLVVLFALLFYTIGIFSEQKNKRITGIVLWSLTLGVFADFTATVLMILGSSKGIFTLHGLIGYSALSGMLVDNVLIWRLRYKHGFGVSVPRCLHIYSQIAYIWWIIAFITGAVLAYFSSVSVARI